MTYKNSTYIQLSEEFTRRYPEAYYAFQLIPEMYNRLTIVDKLSHREAFAKIREDHKELVGFSDRNIRRYLPTDNATVPRRIRSRRPKSSLTEHTEVPNLSNTELAAVVEGYSDGHHSVEYVIEADPIKNRKLELVNISNTDSLAGIQYQIPREKFGILTEALKKSLQVCYVIFDTNDELLKAVADIDK